MCIDGNEDSHQDDQYEPRINLPPASVQAEDEESNGLTGNEVMDGILKHSELSMLNAIARLGQRIDSVGSPVAAHAAKRKPAYQPG